MAVLQFNKQALGNLEYSLQREVLSTNRAGGYMNTTIVCCNTRKYHGLMVCPVPELSDEDDYVLLSSLDEQIIQHDQEFNLAIHRFPGKFEPRGHKYIVDFSYTPTPTIIYRVGGVLLKKEMLWVHTAQQLLIRYTLLEARSETKLRLRPFLAFRSRHALSKANPEADGHANPIEGGVQVRLYKDFPWLNMQVYKAGKKDVKFIPEGPDGRGEWYYNFEYLIEKRRGYDALEDLVTPGYFEMSIEPGEFVIFSGSTEAVEDPKMLAVVGAEELARRSVKTEFLPALYHSARQFLIFQKDHTTLTAGYPWYNARSRETFMALPGITLTQGLTGDCLEILDYHVKNRLKQGIFGDHFAADTQLWFFYTLQRLEKQLDSGGTEIWNRYGKAMKEILYHYREGITPQREKMDKNQSTDGIHMAGNGLIWAEVPGMALTWMNGFSNGQPVTPRPGFAVEVNALWYNAVCYTLELAEKAGDDAFVQDWVDLPELIRENFKDTFWMEQRQGLKSQAYLADYVHHNGFQNEDIRPNQIFACALRYSPLGEFEQQQVMRVAINNLFTPRGLRTLSPDNVRYKGTCRGDEYCRHEARHQGTVFPWLLEHSIRAGFRLYGESFKARAEEIFYGFEEELLNYGIGSLPEMYDGDAPHNPCGAISYAPSVAALLNIHQLIIK